MNIQQDIRWLQRFSNYRKALDKLRQAVEIVSASTDFGDDVDDLLVEGLLQRFEYTHELAWNVMKDFAEYQGYTSVRGSRDAIRNALAIAIIDDARWMESIEDRNLTSHDYDQDTAKQIFKNVTDIYFPLFCQFEEKMMDLSKNIEL